MKRIWRDPLREWLLVLAITALAALLRLLALDRLPPGLYHDEAFNGLDALQVLGGRWSIFFEANNGREPLFIYLAAASVAAWGRSPGALRLVAVLAGTLLVPATYLLGRTLYSRGVGAYAAILAATTVWTLNLSRVALRAGLLPVGVAVALALFWRGLHARRPWNMAWAGVVYGLTFYTYLAARFTLIALLFFALYALLWQRNLLWVRGWALFGLCSLVVVAPLAIYFLQHWETTLGRAGQVSILNPAISGGDLWGTLLRQIGRTLLAPFWRGDFIPRHNVPLRPIFEPLVALATLGGGVLAFARLRRAPAHALTLLWLGVMSLPTILAEGAPHMLRGVGVLPVLLLLPALGLQGAIEQVRPRRVAAASCRVSPSRPVWPHIVATGLVALALTLSAGQNVSAYWRHLNSEAVYYNFEAGATQMAVDINRFLGVGWQGTGLAARAANPQAGRHVYLAQRLWDNWASVRYLAPSSDALTVLAGDAPATPDDADDVLLVLWPYEDTGAALNLLPAGQLISVQEGARERGDLETESRLLYVSYRSQPAQGLPRNATAGWERGIRLVGYEAQALDDATLQVDLYWQTESPLDVGYTVFCHVQQVGAPLGQHDGPACLGYYGTERWRVGDLVRDRHVVALSAPYDPASAQLVVGLYRWETMEHLAVLDGAGASTAATSVTLGPTQQ